MTKANITFIIKYQYKYINTILDTIQLKEELAKMRRVEADTEEEENKITETINKVDTSIRELKDVIRKYYKK